MPDGQGGGAMGMRPLDRYPELFTKAVGQTPQGGIVGPFRSGAGFHVLKVLEKSQAGMPSVVTQNHARHILLRIGDQMTEADAAKRLADYKRRVDSGQASFESLAREFSQDGSARNGGDLGWASPGQFVPEFEQVLNALQPGQVSDPLVSRFGVHLIQLIERRQAALTPREQRDMVRNVVRERKLETDYQTWLQELRGRAYVEYREPRNKTPQAAMAAAVHNGRRCHGAPPCFYETHSSQTLRPELPDRWRHHRRHRACHRSPAGPVHGRDRSGPDGLTQPWSSAWAGSP